MSRADRLDCASDAMSELAARAERADLHNDSRPVTADDAARWESIKRQFLADTAPLQCGKALA